MQVGHSVLPRATERWRRDWDQPFTIGNKKKKKSWTAIRKGSGLVVDERKDLSRAANDEVVATDVRRRGEMITRIGNIYYQKDAQSGERERPARKFNWQRVIQQGSTVLAEDFNAHTK
jgi:hypothetical protein